MLKVVDSGAGREAGEQASALAAAYNGGLIHELIA
jgi:hypothetical protein